MDDQSDWQKCYRPLFTRRTYDGKPFSYWGQIWKRRRPDGKWEYRQDDETEKEWTDRAW